MLTQNLASFQGNIIKLWWLYHYLPKCIHVHAISTKHKSTVFLYDIKIKLYEPRKHLWSVIIDRNWSLGDDFMIYPWPYPCH